jgi:hypothetical protein
MHDLTATTHRHLPTSEPTIVDVGGEMPIDSSEPNRIESELSGIDRLNHAVCHTEESLIEQRYDETTGANDLFETVGPERQPPSRLRSRKLSLMQESSHRGSASVADVFLNAGNLMVQGSADGIEVWAVVAEVVGEFGCPTAAVPVEAGLPSIEEPLWFETFVFGLLYEAMPRVEQIRTAPGLKKVP